jgi:hypothetical protein
MSGCWAAPVAVTFDYPTWQLRYPELAAYVPAAVAQMYFAEAATYCANPSRVIGDSGTLLIILNMITAHIAALNAPLGNQPSSPIVGRISGATEGSVSVQTDLQVPGSAAWFAQSKYGLAAWQAMLPYRTARYIPGGRWGRPYAGGGYPW